MSTEISFKELSAPAHNPKLQNHNSSVFKLVKTVADFTQQLSIIHEKHAEELQLLVGAFRKRAADLRKERSNSSTLDNLWEIFLHEVEVDSQIYGDIGRCLSRKLGTGLLEKSFHRKIQSRKIFLHRESLEKLLNKAEGVLENCKQDYCASYTKLITQHSEANLNEYHEAHNSYVQQLHAFNGMMKLYQSEILPSLLEELQEVYLDINDILSGSVRDASDFMCAKTREQSNHYQSLSSASKQVNCRNDLAHFIKTLNVDKVTSPVRVHTFTSPALANDVSISSNLTGDMAYNSIILSNEIIVDRNSRVSFNIKIDSLRQEMQTQENKIKQIEETLDSLIKLQTRSLDSSLHNKANEIQEEISLKRFDMHVAHMHLAALKSQMELYLTTERELYVDNGPSLHRERKASTTSTATIKMKWFKAFKSLKSGISVPNVDKNDDDKRSLRGNSELGSRFNLYDGQHIFQEYTYKKITPCDVCREILRGHTRQGLKCKMCKINVHSGECQEKAAKCQPKSRLLRRQKSASEIEAKMAFSEMEDEKPLQSIDLVYQHLRTANEVRRNRNPINELNHGLNELDQNWTTSGTNFAPPSLHSRARSNASSSGSSSSSHLLAVTANPLHASNSAPHSPQRKKLSLRMKSFSLDESSQTNVQRTRPATNLYNQSPSSAWKMSFAKDRMNSIDLSTSNEKSSASPSPCPSPQSYGKKPQRLLPTNLYVALYDFRSRHEDEMDLKAGMTLTVTDTSDPDWWQGKSHGHTGLFPSKYVAKLFPNERPLLMTHTIQVSDGENGIIKLLRDQIVIQVGEEMDNLLVRIGATDKVISCPAKYTAEV
ncbi:uncharacterized protein LOC141849193 isoform X1 [Brevipalpus obovatus]|uniref:uncharacterized protein LOC141849193 isoform X1 n=1 Tax=Brevipalpus obovatus TaxID=246614 RepID=UPI003D9F70CC